MAVAKLLCGECGVPLNPADTTCSSCGATVELPARGTPLPGPEAEVRCSVCGHRNPPDAPVCGSCGARLLSAVTPRKPQGEGEQKPRKTQPATPAGRRIEPWQLISGAAVIILLTYLISTSLSDKGSNQSPSAAPVTAPAAVVPLQGMNKVDTAPFELAVRQNPADLGAQLRLANILHDNGDYTRAIETYKTYLSKDPVNPDARVDLGICYFEVAKQGLENPAEYYKLALKEMQTVIRKTPNHQPAAFNLGIVYLNMGDVAESNKWFTRAVEINQHSDLGHRAQNILSQHAFTP
jgi:cytochrome c-type biogenesis protein CcmH/NrfG